MDRMAELATIVNEPYAYLQSIKNQSGKKIVGTVCSYAPEELIHAAGALPVRLFGSDAAGSHADLHLQSYCCSLVRGILGDALAGRLNLLDGMVFPHTCDTIQRLSDVWRINLPQTFHSDVVLPVKLDTPSARQYLMDVLSKFVQELGVKLGHPVSDADLARSVTLFNAIRARLQRLDDLRRSYPSLLTGHDYHTIVRAAMIMEREAFLDVVSEIIAGLEENAPAQKAPNAKRLVLSGGICSHPDIYDVIENAGGVVVGDDLCTGSRYFDGIADENLPALAALVKRVVERAVCPAKHAGLTGRADRLIRTVRNGRADGVVFLLLKFCDPHAFDYPYIKEALDREKIPSLLLEIEDQSQAGGQMETRLETFIQIL